MLRMHHLQERWLEAGSDAEKLLVEQNLVSPFGQTEEGLQDFRCLRLAGNLRLNQVSLKSCDFSYMHGSKLIFADSWIADCRFDSATFSLGDYQSVFERTSFARSKLHGSAVGANGTRYAECDFARADLSGSTGFDAEFRACRFDYAKLKNCVMGGSSFLRCRFVGRVERVIFGGETGAAFIACDFTGASFVDCGFNHIHFERCSTSSGNIVFGDWPRALARFRMMAEAVTDPKLREACDGWISVWEQRSSFTPENLVDRADLEAQFGVEIGESMFDLFRLVPDSVA